MPIRANERMYVDHHKVVIFHGDAISEATLNNCSENGMYVEGGCSFPLDTVLKIIIPLHDNEQLEVPAKVVRLTKMSDCEGMGVEVLNVSLQYKDFLIDQYLGS